MCMKLLQDFHQYIIDHPGSSYARDWAVNHNDVMNARAKAIVCPKKFHADEVDSCTGLPEF